MAHIYKKEYVSRAKNPDGTTRKKKLHKWYVVVEDSSLHGKRKRKSLGGFNTKREAEKAMPELLHKFNSGELDFTKDTFEQFIERYLDGRSPWKNPGKRDTLKKRTHQDYGNMLNRYVIPVIGGKPLAAVSTKDFDDIYQTMLDAKLSLSSIRKLHGTCHKVMADAVNDGHIESNPTDKCRNVPSTSAIKHQQAKRREQRPLWTAEQLKEFLDGSKDHRYWLMFYVSAMTGMRPAEVCGLRWQDINFEDQSLKVNQQIVDIRGVKEFDSPKTANSKRRITLDDKTLELLSDFKNLQSDLIETLGWEDTGLVFLSSTGSSVSPNTFSSEHRKIVKHLGLPHNRLYDLRHLHQTILIASGVDIKTVSTRAGHASVAFTLDVYVKPVDENERAAANVLSAKVFGE